MASSIFNPCTIFLPLLILCMIHGNLAREAPNQDDNHLRLHHDDMMTTHSSLDHIELSWNILFHIEDLKLGKTLNLYFSIKNSTQLSHLIPKQEADLIPFSSSNTAEILDFFSYTQDSPQAKSIRETIHHCELPPLMGEAKFCATSLESMVEKLTSLFGEGSKFRALTTTKVKNWVPHMQNYIIVEEPREIRVKKMFGCHPMPYPYGVYYCHGQASDNKLFMISLEGEDGLKLEAMAICHMDTSQWDPNHASFRMLGIEPGTAPVCHVFPQDNLVWASSDHCDEGN